MCIDVHLGMSYARINACMRTCTLGKPDQRAVRDSDVAWPCLLMAVSTEEKGDDELSQSTPSLHPELRNLAREDGSPSQSRIISTPSNPRKYKGRGRQ